MSSGFVYLRPVPVLFCRQRGPYGASAAKAWDAVLSWLGEVGLRENTANGYGLMHDDPRKVPVTECRYDACVPIPAEFEPRIPEQFSFCYLPGGAFTRQRFKGQQAELANAIVEMRDSWLPEHGLDLDGNRPLITIFYDDPLLVPDGQRKIDICVPIKVSDRGPATRSAA